MPPSEPAGGPVEDLIERSVAAFEDRDVEEALRFAEQALSLDARAVAAHHLRGAALAELSREDEALEAYERALALAPDDLDLVLALAEFLVTRLGEDREACERGAELAQRGRKRARKLGDEAIEGELALVQAIADNQLGDCASALRHADEAVRLLGGLAEARLERGAALFELCRFDEARRQFEEVLEDEPDAAWAHFHLGLLAERRRDGKAAERHFARARKLAPDDFPAEVRLTQAEFDGVVEAALAELPEKVRSYLGNVAIAVEDVPADDDLTGSEPPLSPQILGIFRGSPWRDKGIMDVWSHFPSSIVLYQRNLERFARDRDELVEQIGITLLHEVGHFLGLDEDDLRERGLD